MPHHARHKWFRGEYNTALALVKPIGTGKLTIQCCRCYKDAQTKSCGLQKRLQKLLSVGPSQREGLYNADLDGERDLLQQGESVEQESINRSMEDS